MIVLKKRIYSGPAQGMEGGIKLSGQRSVSARRYEVHEEGAAGYIANFFDKHLGH
jgi:hypothetical protein